MPRWILLWYAPIPPISDLSTAAAAQATSSPATCPAAHHAALTFAAFVGLVLFVRFPMFVVWEIVAGDIEQERELDNHHRHSAKLECFVHSVLL